MTATRCTRSAARRGRSGRRSGWRWNRLFAPAGARKRLGIWTYPEWHQIKRKCFWVKDEACYRIIAVIINIGYGNSLFPANVSVTLRHFCRQHKMIAMPMRSLVLAPQGLTPNLMPFDLSPFQIQGMKRQSCCARADGHLLRMDHALTQQTALRIGLTATACPRYRMIAR